MNHMQTQSTLADMDADAVRALVATKWPSAMKSPLAQMFSGAVAQDETDRAIDFAKLQCKAN